jgi:predicted HicB family RNase H-like nuclease
MGKISETNTRTNITIPKNLKFKLEETAKKQNRSFNNLIITILKDYVDTQK